MEMSDRTRKGMEDRPGIRWGFHRLAFDKSFHGHLQVFKLHVCKCLPHMGKDIIFLSIYSKLWQMQEKD